MTTINKLLGIAFTAMLLMMVNPARTQAQPGVSVSFQTFYDELSPYGTWVEDPDYGDVWVPDAEEGFKPYATRGHWVVTDYGNTWISDYDWGWAPFHYGRWRFDDYYGWEWIPGSQWGPAWVNWRSGGNYYAWAPLGPRVSIDISFGSGYAVPDDYWICAPRAYINSPYIYNYYVPRYRTVTIIHNTTIINNVYVNNNTRFVSGPRPQEIERYTNRPVRVYQMNNDSRPGRTTVQNNTINVYRPTIVRNNSGADRPRPTRVVDATAYRNQNPDASIANRSNGATIHHENASRLAQVARDPQAQNTNVVRVNTRPTVGGNNNNLQPAGNTTPNSNGGFNRDRSNQGYPNNGGNNNNGNQPTRNNPQPVQPQPTPTTAPNTILPADQNNGRFGRNRNTNQPTTTTPANQPTPAATPVITPTNPNPATQNPDNGRFNRNRNRPIQGNPASPNPVVTPPQQQQPQANPQADQAAQQQRQQQADQQRQQMIQRNQQLQQQHQQQMQRPQPQAQPQTQPQAQPQQQRPQPQPQQQPQAQPQQLQRPQPQPRPQQQQRPQPQPVPVEVKKDDKPPVQQ